jgi:MoaD family protein
MGRVTVLMHTALKNKLGKGRVKLKADNMKEVLEKLEEKFGEKFRKQLYEGDKIKGYYIFLRNGNVIDIDQLSQTKLDKGDVVHIFTPTPGG